LYLLEDARAPRRVHEPDAGGILESIMAPADDGDRILADLVGRPLDDHAPVLIVRSARHLCPDELAEGEERELVEDGGVVLEVVFDLDQERWLWHLGVDREDLPGPNEDLSLSEYLQSEVSWRLIEWRDTREQRQSAAAPRLLRAS
jgi:hypothetical protein